MSHVQDGMMTKEIKVGDRIKIPADKNFHPEEGHFGICVWIGKDGKSVAIQCDRSHEGKSTVFIIEINYDK